MSCRREQINVVLYIQVSPEMLNTKALFPFGLFWTVIKCFLETLLHIYNIIINGLIIINSLDTHSIDP